MLRFKVFENGAPARTLNLEGAHLVGAERVPIRAEIRFANGQIVCETRSRGAAALVILWSVPKLGRIMLETPRLLERSEPYNLHVELARGQLMRISQRREDWGLYDYAEGAPLYRDVDAARDLLIDAITAPDDIAATKQGDASLEAGVKIGETIGIFHGELFFKRRAAAAQFGDAPLGVRMSLEECVPPVVKRAAEAFDFVSLPFEWAAVEPKAGVYEMAAQQRAIQSLTAAKIKMIHGHSLLSFDKQHLPTWLPRSIKAFDQLRDVAARRIRHVVKTFAQQVQSWEIVTGIHATNPFKLPFDQIVELTRMSSILVKQTAPRASTVVGLVLPWGEYYARDTQTIPPILYAEMLLQGGVAFDSFGVEIRFACGDYGQFVRDMMQVSGLLDRIAGMGKPIQITAAGVPSSGPTPANGDWHGEWSPEIQAEWLRDFYHIAFSKPTVESVAWCGMLDQGCPGGLLTADYSTKPAYETLLAVRKSMR